MESGGGGRNSGGGGNVVGRLLATLKDNVRDGFAIVAESLKQKSGLAGPSARELLRDKSKLAHSGFLRKRSSRPIQKNYKWKYFFVVIANGHVYYYKDEFADHPSGFFSLIGYLDVKRAAVDVASNASSPPGFDRTIESSEGPGNESVPGAFLLVPRAPDRLKMHRFAAQSDEESKLWMSNFISAIREANENPKSCSPIPGKRSSSHMPPRKDELESPSERMLSTKVVLEETEASDNSSEPEDYLELDEVYLQPSKNFMGKGDAPATVGGQAAGGHGVATAASGSSDAFGSKSRTLPPLPRTTVPELALPSSLALPTPRFSSSSASISPVTAAATLPRRLPPALALSDVAALPSEALRQPETEVQVAATVYEIYDSSQLLPSRLLPALTRPGGGGGSSNAAATAAAMEHAGPGPGAALERAAGDSKPTWVPPSAARCTLPIVEKVQQPSSKPAATASAATAAAVANYAAAKPAALSGLPAAPPLVGGSVGSRQLVAQTPSKPQQQEQLQSPPSAAMHIVPASAGQQPRAGRGPPSGGVSVMLPLGDVKSSLSPPVVSPRTAVLLKPEGCGLGSPLLKSHGGKLSESVSAGSAAAVSRDWGDRQLGVLDAQHVTTAVRSPKLPPKHVQDESRTTIAETHTVSHLPSEIAKTDKEELSNTAKSLPGSATNGPPKIARQFPPPPQVQISVEPTSTPQPSISAASASGSNLKPTHERPSSTSTGASPKPARQFPPPPQQQSSNVSSRQQDQASSRGTHVTEQPPIGRRSAVGSSFYWTGSKDSANSALRGFKGEDGVFLIRDSSDAMTKVLCVTGFGQIHSLKVYQHSYPATQVSWSLAPNGGDGNFHSLDDLVAYHLKEPIPIRDGTVMLKLRRPLTMET